MITQKGPLWLEEAVDADGYLDIPGCEESFHKVHEAIYTLGHEYCHDSLITKLSFGFYRYQFAHNEYIASGSCLLEIFINRPLDISQKDIFQRLTKINKIRNRIAHHEPVCFFRNHISVFDIENRYRIILQLLHWLGYDPNRILYGIDKVRKGVATINNIRNECFNQNL